MAWFILDIRKVERIIRHNILRPFNFCSKIIEMIMVWIFGHARPSLKDKHIVKQVKVILKKEKEANTLYVWKKTIFNAKFLTPILLSFLFFSLFSLLFFPHFFFFWFLRSHMGLSSYNHHVQMKKIPGNPCVTWLMESQIPHIYLKFSDIQGAPPRILSIKMFEITFQFGSDIFLFH